MRAPNLGFVPLEEIQNAFSFEMRRIEEDYKKNGVPTLNGVMEDIDCIRSQLLKRAADNFHAYIKTHPEVKKEMREARKAEEETKDTRGWADRVLASREEARREAKRSALQDS
jgi:hypothetical protein